MYIEAITMKFFWDLFCKVSNYDNFSLVARIENCINFNSSLNYNFTHTALMQTHKNCTWHEEIKSFARTGIRSCDQVNEHNKQQFFAENIRYHYGKKVIFFVCSAYREVKSYRNNKKYYKNGIFWGHTSTRYKYYKN